MSEKFIALVQGRYTFCAFGSAGEGDLASGHDRLGGDQVQIVQDDGGAEQSGGEGIGLGLGRWLFIKALISQREVAASFCGDMTEEDVTELMGDGVTVVVYGAGIVDDDIPLIFEDNGFAVVGGTKNVDVPIGDNTNAALIGDGLEPDGEAVDFKIKQALPSGVSHVSVSAVVHQKSVSTSGAWANSAARFSV